jgi:uncharacterized protein (TIGR03118 family)
LDVLVWLLAISAVALISPDRSGAATLYFQNNLVSDVQGMAAVTDANLKNPWGISFSATSPFWFSDQASIPPTSVLHDGTGAAQPAAQPLVVTIPTLPGTIPGPPSLACGAVGMPSCGGPTGTVIGLSGNFVLSNGVAASFLFDTLDGQIVGWNGAAGTTALNAATTPGAAYSGLALASIGSANYLYATDEHGHINVFDSNFNNVTATTFAGKFVDPSPVPGFNPFNVQNIGGNLYVTYAALTASGFGMPGGYVDEFDSSGTFIKRVATDGALMAPWGVALAPADFGSFSGDLLIGNFGNGQINAYDPLSNALVGQIDGPNGAPLVIPGLWALAFRTGGTGVNTSALYFSAGPNGQRDGLFGSIQVVPEPGTLLITATGLIVAAAIRRRARRQLESLRLKQRP